MQVLSSSILKLRVLIVVVTVLFQFIAFQSNAQLDVKHYIPPMHARDLAGNQYLVLGTPVAATFDITVTDGAGNLIAVIPISNVASSTTLLGTEYNSPFVVTQAGLNTVLSSGKGLILTASEPFYANIRVKATNQAASLTSKGATAAKGKDFRTGHMFNNYGSSDVKSNCASFMATEDNTTVLISNIKPGVVVQGIAAGTTSITVSLNAGQSYVFSTYLDAAASVNNANGLNGAHITSDKDIVVNCGTWLGGNALTGSSPTGATEEGKDIGLDQIVPIGNIGTDYVLIKGFGIDNERTIVVATEDNTQLFLNGSASSSGTINTGDFYVIYGTSFSSNNNLYLKASAPVYVTQSINGSSGITTDNEHCEGMNFIPPVFCTGERIVTVPNVQFIGTAYIQIVANAGAVIQANGSVISGALAVTGTSDYVTYSLAGYTGDVQLVSTEPIRVALINVSGYVGAAGYFSGFSKEINISATYEDNGVEGNGKIVEGCGNATVTIERLQYYASNAITVLLNVSGTATEGVDYSSIPNQLVLAAGQTQVSFTIDAFADLLTEGNESVKISLSVEGNTCGETELEFTITDVAKLQLNVADKNSLCAGDSATFIAEVSGGIEPYNYLWSTGDTTHQITVGPQETESYSVIVTDGCANDTLHDEATVFVPVYDFSVFAGADQTVLCPYTPSTLAAEVTSGLAGYNYSWSANGELISSTAQLNTSPPSTTSYVIEVTDQCGVVVTDTVNINVTVSLMDISVNEDRLICPFDEAELWVSVSEGLPPYSYYWEHSGETDTMVWVNPANSTTYTVNVTDGCATYQLSGYPFVEVVQPIADFSILSHTVVENLPIYFENSSVGGVTWEWIFGNGEYSELFAPGTTYSADGHYDVTLIVTNEMGCIDSITKVIYIKPEFWFYAPNAFTPDGNEFNNTYSVSVIGAVEFSFLIYNRWGELIFESKDPDFEWDGTYNGQLIQDGVFVYTAVVLGVDGETYHYTGHINLLK